MQLPRGSESGFILPTIAIALLSLLLGGGAAVLAVSSVVNSAGASDQVAVQSGPKDILPPDAIISYGG